jgi:propionyl-CoA carboxylase alpha chain
MRDEMGAAALAVCKACDYSGAGTVEFLLDASLDFYFLEMNTRLQVEHPVTEKISGVDLVEWQVRVARGEELPLKQEDLSIHGHAIEVRVYAEDARSGFTPDIGTLNKYRRPLGTNVRVDDAFEEGMEIPIYYDPMLAKLVVWGKDRQTCIENTITAIDDYQISGVNTTLDFGKFVLQHPSFRSGDFDTNFIQKYLPDSSLLHRELKEEGKALEAAIEQIWVREIDLKNADFSSQEITSSWKRSGNK